MTKPAFPFTRRCAEAGIPTPAPTAAWFKERDMSVPVTPAGKIEACAAHAWARANMSSPSRGVFDTSAWDSLPKAELAFLRSACKNPLKRAADSANDACARFLELTLSPPPAPRPPAPPRAASGSAAQRLSFEPEDLLGSGSGARKRTRSAHDPASAIAASGNLPAEVAADLADPAFAHRLNQVLEAFSPAARSDLLAGSGRPPSPSGGGSAATALELPAAPGGKVRNSLLGGLTYSYAQLKAGLGPVYHSLLDNTGDWSVKDRTAFGQACDAVAKGGPTKPSTAAIMCLEDRPPYLFMLNLLRVLPEGADLSRRLGEVLAKAARCKPAASDPYAFRSRDATDRQAHLALWAELCAASVSDDSEAAYSRLVPVLNVVRGHFQERVETLGAYMRRQDLGEVEDLLVKQRIDLEAFLLEQMNRISAKVANAGDDRARTWNTEWIEVLFPFFRDILGATAIRADPSRVAAARAVAIAAVGLISSTG